jgi:hypothetical protein
VIYLCERQGYFRGSPTPLSSVSLINIWGLTLRNTRSPSLEPTTIRASRWRSMRCSNIHKTRCAHLPLFEPPAVNVGSDLASRHQNREAQYAQGRVAAILAADVAGYSRRMGADKEGTHERLQAHLQELVNPKIEQHRGRIVKNAGDGMLVEFSSVVDEAGRDQIARPIENAEACERAC